MEFSNIKTKDFLQLTVLSALFLLFATRLASTPSYNNFDSGISNELAFVSSGFDSSDGRLPESENLVPLLNLVSFIVRLIFPVLIFLAIGAHYFPKGLNIYFITSSSQAP